MLTLNLYGDKCHINGGDAWVFKERVFQKSCVA